MRYVGGIDVGGTSVKAGVVDETGNILAKAAVPVDSPCDFESIVTAVGRRLDGLAREAGVRLSGVGIGAPGFADKSTGVIVDGVRNIPCLRGHSIPQRLADSLGVPCFIDNDATCAAAGELAFGAGRGVRSFALITLGTGIGGGLVFDGSVFRGTRGFAAEIGHMCLDPNGPWCNCGSRGCFEQYASAPTIVRLYREKLVQRGMDAPQGELEARDVFQAAARDEPLATDVVDEVGRRIAQAFGTLINVLNLDACIIGGGVSAAGETLLEPVRRHLPDFAWRLLHRDVEVRIAALKNDAGILGAAAGALDQLSGRA